MGTFDEAEYERREKQINSVNTDTDDWRTNFEGHVTFTDDSIEDLLSEFKRLKAEKTAKHSPMNSDSRNKK